MIVFVRLTFYGIQITRALEEIVEDACHAVYLHNLVYTQKTHAQNYNHKNPVSIPGLRVHQARKPRKSHVQTPPGTTTKKNSSTVGRPYSMGSRMC